MSETTIRQRSAMRRKRACRVVLLTGLRASVLLPAAPAFAEERDGVAEERPPIMVTARKREELAQDVPISMTVLTAEEIAERGANSLRDLEHSVPNLVFTSVDNAVSPEISLRGISSDARNIGFESGLSMYVDGVYTGRPSSFSTDMLDVAQIEVLRGPQGTLFGKNTTAGAINITTGKPTQELEGHVELQYGNYDLFRGRAVVNAPIVEGVAALRIGGYVRTRGGYQHNLYDDSHVYNEDSKGGMAKLLLTPSSTFDLTLSADFARDRYRPNVNEISAGFGSTGIPRTVDIDTPVFQTRDIFGTSATGNLDLGGVALTSITAYRSANTEFLSDDDASEFPFLTGNFVEKQWQFSQELRLASTGTGPFSWVAGLFYYHQDVETTRLSRLTDLLPYQIDVTLDGEVKTESYAAFAQADYDLTDTLTLSAGARYTHERKRLYMDLHGAVEFGIGTVFIDGQHHTDDDFSPSVSLAWQPTPSLNLYAKVARGFKAGGFNADYVPDAHVEFEPETATNYEVGAKFLSPDRRLNANLAVFVTDYRDLQVIQFQQFNGFVISNAAQATIKGAEFDFDFEPVDGLEVDGGVGYLDATFDSFKDAGGPGVDYDGNRLTEAPRWTLSLGAQYTAQIADVGAVTLRGDMTYRDDRYVDPENLPSDELPGYALFNARLGFTTADDRWTFEVWGRNLANKLYLNARGVPVLGGILGQEYVNYGAPRTYGLRATASF